MTVVLAIGTGQGPLLATSEDDRTTFEVGAPHLPMTAIYAVGG